MNVLIRAKETIYTIFAFPAETLIGSSAISLLWALIEPEISVILLVSAMVFIDTALGLWAAWRKKNISSRKFSKIFEKLIVYICLLTASHLPVVTLTDAVSQLIFVPLQSIILISVILRELISIIETCQALGIYIVPKKLAEKIEEYHDYVN